MCEHRKSLLQWEKVDCEARRMRCYKAKLLFPQTRVVVGADPYEFVQKRTNPSLPLRVAKRHEGLKKQHSVVFFPERDRAHANPQNSTALVSGNPYRRRDKGANI